ncbi:MAG TPA: hypothetical protein VGL71_00150 [Urbifossiella sp.]
MTAPWERTRPGVDVDTNFSDGVATEASGFSRCFLVKIADLRRPTAAFPIDNPINASHQTIAHNPHHYRDNVNPQTSAQIDTVFSPTLPSSISHLASARQ